MSMDEILPRIQELREFNLTPLLGKLLSTQIEVEGERRRLTDYTAFILQSADKLTQYALDTRSNVSPSRKDKFATAKYRTLREQLERDRRALSEQTEETRQVEAKLTKHEQKLSDAVQRLAGLIEEISLGLNMETQHQSDGSERSSVSALAEAESEHSVPALAEYHDLVGDIKVCESRLADLEIERTDAITERERLLDQGSSLKVTDAEFESPFIARREHILQQLAEAKDKAGRARQECLHLGFDVIGSNESGLLDSRLTGLEPDPVPMKQVVTGWLASVEDNVQSQALLAEVKTQFSSNPRHQRETSSPEALVQRSVLSPTATPFTSSKGPRQYPEAVVLPFDESHRHRDSQHQYQFEGRQSSKPGSVTLPHIHECGGYGPLHPADTQTNTDSLPGIMSSKAENSVPMLKPLSFPDNDYVNANTTSSFTNAGNGFQVPADHEPIDSVDSTTRKAMLTRCGPADQITDPHLFRAGISANLKLYGGIDEDTAREYPKFRKKANPRNFFKVGRVFMILWAEPAVESSKQSLVSSTILSNGKYGERIYSKIRRFVVIREANDYCSALSILSYGREGVAKKGVVKAEHGIIHTGKTAPEPRPAEIPHRGEKPMRPIAIRVDPIDPTDKLMPESRINYGKVYTIEHTIRVKDLGCVNRNSLKGLMYQFSAVWLRSDGVTGDLQSQAANYRHRSLESAEVVDALVARGYSREEAIVVLQKNEKGSVDQR